MAKYPGVGGVYEIQCEKNGKLYIGQTKHVGLRWGKHLSLLTTRKHSNKQLQEDFDKYGVSAFRFSVLDVCSDKDELSYLEKRRICEHDRSMLYNALLYGEWELGTVQVEKFIKYINGKWLVEPSETNHNHHKRIWRKEDKYEIRKCFWDCRLDRRSFDRITFNSVIKTLERALGYSIKSGRQRVDDKQITYKLVVSFDEEKVDVNGIDRGIEEYGCYCTKETA